MQISDAKKRVIARRITGFYCALYSEKYDVLLSKAVIHYFKNPQVEQVIYDWCENLTEDNEQEQLDFAKILLEQNNANLNII